MNLSMYMREEWEAMRRLGNVPIREYLTMPFAMIRCWWCGWEWVGARRGLRWNPMFKTWE
jgi:hypothetical protein